MASKETDACLKGLEDKFKRSGLSDRLMAEALKSKLVRTSLDKTIDEYPQTSPDPTAAALLYALASATQKGTFDTRPKVTKAILDGRLKSPKQVEGKRS